jgi:hypothetical protein
MTPMCILSELHDRRVLLIATGGKLYVHPWSKLPPDLRAEIRDCRISLLAQLTPSGTEFAIGGYVETYDQFVGTNHPPFSEAKPPDASVQERQGLLDAASQTGGAVVRVSYSCTATSKPTQQVRNSGAPHNEAPSATAEGHHAGAK